ncbi:AI-2E family transporter [Allosediminivita pacifica]|uniref:Putative PurR-regulated permease PerM n=1 Tax=Allosediminivita pacifica TaxID=1267769 RepID=A0A2T6B2B1_9RHOB|nr:AI-2E family transporter [Allosediminivita pacifica]PTX50165.1 putative PurR-regulated permease PerM [Allosediminivita pacifica]GGB01903.1 AI-2E family transporter [Allosediminivita pacifica]
MTTEEQAGPEPATKGAVPRWAVIGIFLLLFVAGLAYARSFLMPMVLALLLMLVFSPVRRQAERFGLPTGLAATLIVGTLLTGLAAGVLTLSAPVADWVDRAPTLGYELRYKLEELRGMTEGMQKAADQFGEFTEGEAEPGVQRVKIEEDSTAFGFLMTIPSVIAQMVFTLILLFFLLASGDMFYEKIVHVLPAFSDKRRAIRIAYDIERKLSRYLFTITVINAGLGVSVGISMWLLDMPNAILFGVLACLLNFIPYLGALAGVAAAAVVGILSLSSINEAAVVAGVYFLLTSIEGQLVTPYFVGRSLRLNTVMVFLSVMFFAWLWTVVGMLVALPLLVAVRTFCEHIPQLEGVGHFLSARGAEKPQRPAEAE